MLTVPTCYSVRKLENDYQMGPEALWAPSEMVSGQNFIYLLTSVFPPSNREAMGVLWVPK